MDAFILPQVRTFCDILNDEKEKNMTELLSNMSFDIMGEMCFGKSFDMQKSEENRLVIRLIEGRFRRASVVCSFPSPPTPPLTQC